MRVCLFRGPYLTDLRTTPIAGDSQDSETQNLNNDVSRFRGPTERSCVRYLIL
jgi:hypothetical protein